MINKFEWIDDAEFDFACLSAPFYIYTVYCLGCEMMMFFD